MSWTIEHTSLTTTVTYLCKPLLIHRLRKGQKYELAWETGTGYIPRGLPMSVLTWLDVQGQTATIIWHIINAQIK